MQNANSQFASEWSIWGRIVESRGPRILLASDFAFFLGGSDISDSGLTPDALSAPIIFYALLLCSFLTEVGPGALGLYKFLIYNTTAKTFRDRAVCVH